MCRRSGRGPRGPTTEDRGSRGQCTMHLSARPPLARIMAIDQAIRSGSWPNARTLARRLEVHPRTVQRDITYLRDQLRAPVDFDPIHNGYRYTEPAYRLPYFQLTEGELVALLLAGRLLGQYRGTPFEADLGRAFAKLRALLPETAWVRLDAAADCLSVLPAVRTPLDPAAFATLSGAVVGRRRVEMVYWTASRNATTSRDLDPYHLALVGDDWCVIGHCHRRGEVLVFSIQDQPVPVRDEDTGLHRTRPGRPRPPAVRIRARRTGPGRRARGGPRDRGRRRGAARRRLSRSPVPPARGPGRMAPGHAGERAGARGAGAGLKNSGGELSPGVDQVDSGAGTPVAEQPVPEVLGLERLRRGRIGIQSDGGPPPTPRRGARSVPLPRGGTPRRAGACGQGVLGVTRIGSSR
jgi:hypothetical protein